MSFTQCSSITIREWFVIVMLLSTVQLQFGILNRVWNLSELHPFRASSVVLRGFFCFLWLSNHLVALSCVNDERIRDYSHRFITVTARQPQLQILSNRHVWTTLFLICINLQFTFVMLDRITCAVIIFSSGSSNILKRTLLCLKFLIGVYSWTPYSKLDQDSKWVMPAKPTLNSFHPIRASS